MVVGRRAVGSLLGLPFGWLFRLLTD